jgi:hypothetical protein
MADSPGPGVTFGRIAGAVLRGFVMADPDGNRIDIGQRLPAWPDTMSACPRRSSPRT